MNIYIVEDEIFHLEDLKITLEELGYTCIGNSNDPFEAQEQIGKLNPEVVLLDIHLNGKQAGIDLGRRIKTLYNIPTLFTSSDCSPTIISQAADIEPIAYITKPINKKDLQAAMILAEKKISTIKNKNTAEEPSNVFIKSGNKLVKVTIDSILFAHTDSKNYCSLVTSDNKKLSVRYSILGLHKLLNNDVFVQTHRSYIINWRKVNFFYESDQTIEIEGYRIPVGRTFKSDVYKKLKII
ncbi:LytR/AlgR family response regulator transcription factor [Aquimarina longa]|uniref:LytR/AlgR family response regulator transcription factor n=1 Tax=Aquimarina longa TaxID=1080221 RepID=UPI000784DF1E|nr:response regulator transcription factor [Aquimarina longa]